MRYLSVCSGIEAATVAWHHLGWKPAAFSEIEKFPRAVLTHHYPEVPLFGDFTSLTEKDYGAINLLVGGTPCQSFSIAGLRKGLADDRGNLSLEFIRLAKASRARWVVWENVPGVLSIDGGRAFGSFLGGLAECGYGFAYRILDAQYFGVPQRRRRVFVVGYLGDWRPAAAVLFEREGMRGDITPRREARERIAPTISARTRGGGGLGTDFDCDGGLITHTLRGDGFDASEDGTGHGIPLVTFDRKSFGEYGEADIASTVSARDYKNATDLVAIPLQEVGKRTGKSTDDASIGGGIGQDGDAMFTLQAAAQHGVASFKTGQSADSRSIGYNEHLAPTLEAGGGGNSRPAIIQQMALRRLTPRECERLQGFPDDYTLVPFRGKLAADGNRYKALGNSMAVPVMRWLGERIKAVDELQNPDGGRDHQGIA